ncbi:SDR family NAD(P)-dependent oxidoreductase [Maricaulis sp. D1M11]|uniref:SDR family NAD(P)-dependent oxidoreductase n=1 Tax=Maricaulis sp. D1M11 TaxID=3076117 RepID=UPI0039B42B82
MTQSQVILITGASDGFGHLAAEKLLAKGHVVYATARRVDRMRDLQQQGAQTLHLDVTDTAEVQRVVSQIIAEQGRIDVLVNNAGFGQYGVVEAVSEDQLKYQFDVNVFGMHRLQQAVLPHMRDRQSGKIINLASIVSHVSAPLLGWYAATKHAIKGMTEALRMEVRDLGIDVVAIEPGAVRTGFEAVAFASMETLDTPADYDPLIEGMSNATRNMYASSPGPQSTARAIVRAVQARRPKAVYKTTPDSHILPRLKRLIGDRRYGALNLWMARRTLKRS